MKYELIRLFRDRYVRILMAIIFITSMLLFHHSLTDSTYTYSYQQIGMKYSLNTDIEAEIRELDELIMNGMYEASDEYVTGWPSLEKRLDDHILERNTQALGYQDWRKQYLAENSIKISSGLFGDEHSFDVRTLKKANAVYEKLDTIQTEKGFWGIETVYKYRLTDLFIILSAVLLSMKLVLDDRRGNMELLQKSTLRGSTLVYKKLGAVILIQTVFIMFLYAGEFFIAWTVLPSGSLRAAIQSVYGFTQVPMAVSVIGFLCLFMIFRLLWALSVTMIVFTIVHLTDGLLSSVIAMIIMLLIQLFMAGSSSLWLRSLSLLQISDSADLLSRLVYLNLFGIPVNKLLVMTLWVIILSCACIVLLRIRKQPVISAKRIRSYKKKMYPVSLYEIERRKLLIHSKGLLLACLLIGVQIYRACDTRISLSAEEYAYRNYSLVLLGEKNESKDAYIQEQRDTFAYWHSLLDQYMADESLSEEAKSILSAEIFGHLNNEMAFEKATGQYVSLGKDEVYLYKTGYEHLYGIAGRKEDILSAAFLMLVITFVISVNEVRENESGMAIQISASASRKNVRRIRVVQYGIYAALLVIPVFIPYLLKVSHSIGLYGIQYPAVSLHMFPEWTQGLHIIAILILTYIIRMILVSSAAVFFYQLVHRFSNLSVAFSIGLFLLVMPFVVIYLMF